MSGPGPREVPPSGLPIGRAAFLATIAAGAAGLLAGPRLSRSLDGVGGILPLPAAAFGGADRWRIYSVASPMPVFRPESYTLIIDGLLERPSTLTWPQLSALPAEEQTSDFHCVTGWSVRGVRWEGVRPATLIKLARPRPEARYVTFFSLEEPYADQLSIEQFTLPDVLLARRMDGRPLKREHGAPLRLVIPQMYGYKGVKWVSGIRFDAEPGLGYWEQRGYDVNAWVGRSNGIGA